MSSDKKGPSRRELNALEMKSKIFNTAIMLFSKHSYDKVKVDDIIKYAGVSKGTFYTYFPSKDSVLIDLFHKIDQHYELTFKSVPPDTSAADRLLIFVRAVGEYCGYVCGPSVMKVVYMNQIGLQKHPSIINNKERIFYKLALEIVQIGKRTGEFATEIPDDEMAEFITREVRSLIYDWCLYDGAYDLIGAAMRQFEILIDLFKSKSALARAAGAAGTPEGSGGTAGQVAAPVPVPLRDARTPRKTKK